MSNMDEISYWIHTKRAPCLYKYDNVIKRQYEKSQSFVPKPKSESETEKLSSPVKKKKRKISILDDSGSTEKQHNIYFETSQQNKTIMSSCKSDTLGSDVDFNIKNSSIKAKPKRLKLQKNNHSALKKNKVTSTPKPPGNLRRSQRTPRKCLNLNQNNTFNSSFEEFTMEIVNDHNRNQTKKEIKLQPDTDKITDNNDKDNKNKSRVDNKQVNANGQYDDMSDVSGFTANYIRSTKMHAGKNVKARSKPNRTLIKCSQPSDMVICMNKSTLCPPDPKLNSSMDSSQNIINLITYEKNGNASKVNKGTSLLKFVNAKLDKVNNTKAKHKQKQAINMSKQSEHSAISRYPKRNKKATEDITKNNEEVESVQTRRCNRNRDKNNDSDRKENPEEMSVSRTRSGRSIGLSLRQAENSLLVLSNSTEQVSSAVTMNVATPDSKVTRGRRKNVSSVRCIRTKRTANKSGDSVQRETVRDKSGFAACFSDSDDDKPLKTQKFFC